MANTHYIPLNIMLDLFTKNVFSHNALKKLLTLLIWTGRNQKRSYLSRSHERTKIRKRTIYYNFVLSLFRVFVFVFNMLPRKT